MEDAFGESFALANYDLPKRLGKLSVSSLLYAKYEKSQSRAEGYVTISAQGDGVHVLDVSL